MVQDGKIYGRTGKETFFLTGLLFSRLRYVV